MAYYAYLHIKPEGRLEDIFYVGKGTEKRIALLSRKNRHHTNIVSKYGKENILVKTLECSTEAAAFELEIGLIKCLKRMGVELCNRTDGGDGSQGLLHTDAAKAKMSLVQTGRVHTEETKAKMSATSTGKRHTDAAKTKMSTAKKKSNPFQKLL